jgi:hypothetical protein
MNWLHVAHQVRRCLWWPVIIGGATLLFWSAWEGLKPWVTK